jgi:hypothetical protein
MSRAEPPRTPGLVELFLRPILRSGQRQAERLGRQHASRSLQTSGEALVAVPLLVRHVVPLIVSSIVSPPGLQRVF